MPALKNIADEVNAEVDIVEECAVPVPYNMFILHTDSCSIQLIEKV
jgi:hypothetical protein